MIKRAINLEAHLEKNKVLIIYGPRQVGKTTLVHQFLSQTKLRHTLFTGDELGFAKDFGACDLEFIKKTFSKTELLVIDEAQKIENIGRALKLTVDHLPDIYVVVTGSSSFDLANSMDEPLTGRKNIITLYPISLNELTKAQSPYELERSVGDHLIYGMYPNIITYKTYAEKENRIKEIANAYVIKDVLEFHKVKRSEAVVNLLRLLAFQIGSEVSTSELGQQLGLDHKTVARYLHLLEQSFVIFRLNGFSRNLRKEISKMSKYYFFDTGVRNALISNFNSLEQRNDVGQLWENFIMMERIKGNAYSKLSVNYYFWRTWDQKEIALIEERGGKLCGYEFKWGGKKARPPKDWLETYKEASFEVIDRENYLDFVA